MLDLKALLNKILTQWGGSLTSKLYSIFSHLERWWEHVRPKETTDEALESTVQRVRPNGDSFAGVDGKRLLESNMGICYDKRSVRRPNRCLGRIDIHKWLGPPHQDGVNNTAYLQIYGVGINKRVKNTYHSLALAHLISERGCA